MLFSSISARFCFAALLVWDCVCILVWDLFCGFSGVKIQTLILFRTFIFCMFNNSFCISIFFFCWDSKLFTSLSFTLVTDAECLDWCDLFTTLFAFGFALLSQFFLKALNVSLVKSDKRLKKFLFCVSFYVDNLFPENLICIDCCSCRVTQVARAGLFLNVHQFTIW